MFVVLAIGLLAAIVGKNGAVIAVLALIGILFIVAAIVYAVALAFIDRLGARAIVLEQLGATAALRRGYTLLTKRLGRVLLVWLLSIAVGIVLGIGFAIVAAVLVVPAVIIPRTEATTPRTAATSRPSCRWTCGGSTSFTRSTRCPGKPSWAPD